MPRKTKATDSTSDESSDKNLLDPAEIISGGRRGTHTFRVDYQPIVETGINFGDRVFFVKNRKPKKPNELVAVLTSDDDYLVKLAKDTTDFRANLFQLATVDGERVKNSAPKTRKPAGEATLGVVTWILRNVETKS